MKILVIDNTIDADSWGSHQLCRAIKKSASVSCTVFVRRAPEGDLPKSPESFDRVIVSGSKTSALEQAPWIDDLLNFIRRTVEYKIPYLGVCFGHQMLARSLCGLEAVRRSQTPEFGWSNIQVTDHSRLLKEMPTDFYSFSAHFDEVWNLPKNAKKVAISKDCAIQAIELVDSPTFGIQFHPEKNLEDATNIFLTRKKLGEPKTFLNEHQGKKLYDESICDKIFQNFLTIK